MLPALAVLAGKWDCKRSRSSGYRPPSQLTQCARTDQCSSKIQLRETHLGVYLLAFDDDAESVSNVVGLLEVGVGHLLPLVGQVGRHVAFGLIFSCAATL